MTDGQTDWTLHRAAWSQLKTTRTTRTPAFWDTPTAPWLPILVIHIRSQVKTRQSQNFEILQETIHATHLLKLLDKMHKYEMDPTRTVGATERTRDAGQTDGRGETNTVDSRYLAPVGNQNSRARVKWFSRYIALSREGHDSRIQDHWHTLPVVYNSQTVCWAIIQVLTFPGSLHTSTSHQRQITTSNIRF